MLWPQFVLEGAKKDQTQVNTEQNEFEATCKWICLKLYLKINTKDAIKINPISVAGVQLSTPVKDVEKLGEGETEAITQSTAGRNPVQTAVGAETSPGAAANPPDVIPTTENSAAQASISGQLEDSTGSQDFVNSLSPTNPPDSGASIIKITAASTSAISNASLDGNTTATTPAASNLTSKKTNSTNAIVNSTASTVNSSATTVNSSVATMNSTAATVNSTTATAFTAASFATDNSTSATSTSTYPITGIKDAEVKSLAAMIYFNVLTNLIFFKGALQLQQFIFVDKCEKTFT